jgi:hypothetical protein
MSWFIWLLYSGLSLSCFFITAPLQATSGLEQNKAIKKHAVRPKKDRRHPLAVCTIFRNEARFLREWIEFHKLVGVTRFYLYNHMSEDNYQEVLAPYIASGEVKLTDWFYPNNSATVEEWTLIQTRAYQDAIAKATNRVKWLAVLDSDEFLYAVEEDHLPTYLAAFENAGGVVAHWQLFGTSHVSRIPPDRLMIELLTLKAPDGYGENSFVKSIVRPERVRTMTDPHFAHYKTPYQAVNQNGHPVPHSLSPIVVNKLRINHYWSRDEDFFYSTKVARRQAWNEGFDGQIRRLEAINQVEDHTIQRFVPALRQRLVLPHDGAESTFSCGLFARISVA